MTPELQPEWWPAKQLAARPIRRVLACGRTLRPPMPSHMVGFPRLEIPLSGCYETQIETEGRAVTVVLKPGDALFAAPNCWNSPVWRRKVELLSLLFGARQIGISVVTSGGARRPRPDSKKVSLPSPLAGPLPHIIEAMGEAQIAPGFSVPPALFADLARALVRCVGAMLESPPAAAAEGGRSQVLFGNLCIYLQNNYQGDISRETVARQFEITPTHLSRVFQTRGHMTFNSYLTHVRIDRAKYLLRHYNFKLDDIAARCGYAHTTYFCQMFKRVTKATPAEYRSKTRAPGR
jgi:AraC-like DNA-binding protein